MAGTRKGAYWSEYGAGIAASTREEALSGYCPNSAEWFAEMFRLFVTNPDLLSYIRPRTFSALARDGWKPAVDEDWQTVLANAPGRTYDACEKKVMLAAKKIGLG